MEQNRFNLDWLLYEQVKLENYLECREYRKIAIIKQREFESQPRLGLPSSYLPNVIYYPDRNKKRKKAF